MKGMRLVYTSKKTSNGHVLVFEDDYYLTVTLCDNSGVHKQLMTVVNRSISGQFFDRLEEMKTVARDHANQLLKRNQ